MLERALVPEPTEPIVVIAKHRGQRGLLPIVTPSFKGANNHLTATLQLQDAGQSSARLAINQLVAERQEDITSAVGSRNIVPSTH